ncbi:MAG: DNA topoisomerase I, partial [Alphaproteobacteria bacterium]|nr:DNA topoisomerase I [Alphaproteobacteria bacterium]
MVESPAKAKTINKYLGSDYRVMASIGHVRDLVQKDGSVDPDADFAMRWEDTGRTIAELAKQFKAADEIYLATDPDREGEAIAWHIKELMQEKKALKDQTLHRITFNEITKNAVQTAIKQPRDLDQPLIDAYLARRCLDYLVGFSLSPVLWRKLPGAKSAGRVQSVALRLICEREAEIEKFLPQEYWSLEALFANEAGQVFPARLWAADGTKLDKFALGNQGSADAALERAKKLLWAIGAIDRKQVRRNPDAPFTTSTLQMAASRQLGMGATRTMRLAQQLYEGVDIGGETVGL